MASTTAVRRIDSQWFSYWFDSIHYHKLYAHRDHAEAAAFLDRLIRRLRPIDGSRVLDLGCGSGRHAKYLAARGLRVTGIDLAAKSIKEAKRWERSGLRFVRHDMRVPFGRSLFDHIFNFFTSFGYFGPAEHRGVIRNMADALKMGGALVLDYLNVRYAEKHMTRQEVKTIDGIGYRVTRWRNASHLFKRIVIEDEHGQPTEYVERVAKFELQDFQRMFTLHGLTVDDVYGDYQLNPYDPDASPRMILIARKTGCIPHPPTSPRATTPRCTARCNKPRLAF